MHPHLIRKTSKKRNVYRQKHALLSRIEWITLFMNPVGYSILTTQILLSANINPELGFEMLHKTLNLTLLIIR